MKEIKPPKRRISTMIDEPAFWVKIPRREVFVEFLVNIIVAAILAYLIILGWGFTGWLDWLLIRYE